VQIYQGTSAAGKLVYQLSGSKTVRNEELNVTMDPSNYGTATKPHGYRKSQGRSALAERPSFRSGVLECPIAAGLYIKFTSDSRAVDLQGFNAAYYVTRVTDGTAISASQVEPERSDWSVRPYCGTPPLSSDFLIRCWIIPTRVTNTSATGCRRVGLWRILCTGLHFLDDPDCSFRSRERRQRIQVAPHLIAPRLADARRSAPLPALSFFGRREWTSPIQTRFMGGAGIRTM
jgi:hypothetical protein